MKKSKKLILLYFLHQHQHSKNMQQSHSYGEIYAAVPIAGSTIRGILNEFEGERYVRKITSRSSVLWQLTQIGIRTAESIFGRLTESSAHPLHLIRVHESPRALSDLQRLYLDTHTYAVFGEEERVLNRRFPRSLVLPLPVASEKVIVQSWLESVSGRKHIRNRELISRQISVLFPHRKNDRVLSLHMRSRQQKILSLIISAIENNSQCPEKYYSHHLRVNDFLGTLW